MKYRLRTGFTIVELLIVIVVIGILAAITIVAYNGVQTRANANGSLSDLASFNKLVQLYYTDNGNYPVSTSWSGLTKTTNFIPGIVPTYTNLLPQSRMPNLDTCGGGTYAAAYIYRSTANGVDYKLLAHCDNLCATVKLQKPAMIDPTRDNITYGCWAYGYWSSGGSSL